MLRWHLWLSTHLFSLGKCDATQFLHHIGRLATAPANLQPSSRLQPMHPWSPPQLGHPWALSSSGMWANMIKASVTTAHLSYRFPILKLPPPPCAVLLVFYNAFTHYLDRDDWYNYIAYRCTVYCIVCVHCLLLMVLALRFSQITQISCEFWISRTVPTLTPKCSFQNHFPGFYILHFLFCLGMFLGNTVDVTDSNLDPTFTGQTPEEAWRCMKGWGRQTFK